MNFSRSRAFTLIELLVVIAIIAILAAILFPVFAQAKGAAKKTQSLSNTKNLGLGIQMYTIDSDDILPMLQYQNPDWISWPRMVHPYVKNGNGGTTANPNANLFGVGGIFRAPGDPTQQENGSYGLHQDLARDGTAPWNNTTNIATFSTTQINNLAEKVYMVEKGINRGWATWLQFGAWEWDWVDWVDFDRATGQARRDGANIAVQPGKGDCDFQWSTNVFSSFDGDMWARCGMLPRYRYNNSTPTVFLDGHAKTFNRTANNSSMLWFRYIYVPEAQQYPSSWYPY
jgi:prepilin-type N-terminal cleavage/methylation domain-containing protein